MSNFYFFENFGREIINGKNIEEALIEGLLNYKVVKEATFTAPYLYDDNGEHIIDQNGQWAIDMSQAILMPNLATTVKIANGQRFPIDVVKQSYGIVQNAEALSVIDTLLAKTGGKIIRVGEYGTKKNAVKGSLFVVIELPPVTILGEEYKLYLLFTNSFDGSSAVRVCFTPTRVACKNTLPLAFKNAIASLIVRHTITAPERFAEGDRILKEHSVQIKLLTEDCEYLAKIAVSKAQYQNKIIPAVLKADNVLPDSDEKKRNKDRYERLFGELVKTYEAADLGNLNSTAFKALQAVADYETHHEPDKNKNNYQQYFTRAVAGMPLTTVAHNVIVDQFVTK